MPVRISATIVTFNEEKNIARAIGSLACADDILVVDSGSSDRTASIATSLGARVLIEPWRGYAGQKNFAAEAALNDWILSIDADEALTPELNREILRIRDSEPTASGYTMPRKAHYLGRWIHHSGWYPDRKIRLYDRRRARWQGEYVHESVKATGLVSELQGDLLHYTCNSLSEHMRTLERYTTLAAQELVAHGKGRQPAKMIVDPAWTFFRSYVMQFGFLDGPQGAAIAWMAALYTFLKYGKAWELSRGPAEERGPR